VPDGCGSLAEFRREIARLTGSPAADDVPRSLLIEALEAGRQGYSLQLVLGDEVRTLRDLDCRVLFRSAVVIAAAAQGEGATAAPADGAASAAAPPVPAAPPANPVPVAVAPAAPAGAALQPLAPSPSPANGPRPPGAPTPAPVAARPVARASVPRWAVTPRERQNARLARSRYARAAARTDTSLSRSAQPRVPLASAPDARVEPPQGTPRYGLDLGAGVSGGVLPGLGAVLELGARLEDLPAGLELSFRYWPQRSGGRDGRGLDVSALGARVAALLRVAPALNVLAGVELTRLEGEGSASLPGRTSDSAWHLAPTLGVNLIAWDIRYLRLEIGAAGRLSLLRPRFVVTGFGDLYRVPVLGADAIIRGVWLFP
jgi:hypothetical protein